MIWERVVVLGIPLGILCYDHIGTVATVDGISMQPCLNPNGDTPPRDKVFLSRWTARDFRFTDGELVAVINPRNPSDLLVKRIIGLEGDVIRTLGYKEDTVVVPKGYCWVEGDNTGHTYDSNVFGAIPLGLIVAKAVAVVWPPSRWQRLASEVPWDRNSIVWQEDLG